MLAGGTNSEVDDGMWYAHALLAASVRAFRPHRAERMSACVNSLCHVQRSNDFDRKQAFLYLQAPKIVIFPKFRCFFGPPVVIVAVCPETVKVPAETTISLMLLPIIVPSVTVSKPLPRSEPVYSGGVEDAMFHH